MARLPKNAVLLAKSASGFAGTGACTGMSLWRKRLFIALAHNAANPTEYFCLPHERTVVMGTWVDV